jgi:hypothetical protein
MLKPYKKKLGERITKEKICFHCTIRFFEVPHILEQLLKGVVLSPRNYMV